MKVRPLLAATSLVLALAACGAGGEQSAGNDGIAAVNGATARPTASASASVDRREAQLRFAQCMREHGMDVPDPGPDGMVRIQRPRGVDQAKAEAATRDCRHFMDDAIGDRANAAKDPKARDQMLKYAQCMREHGVDMPDPGADGQFRIQIPKGGEQKLKEVEEACKEFAPGLGKQGRPQ